MLAEGLFSGKLCLARAHARMRTRPQETGSVGVGERRSPRFLTQHFPSRAHAQARMVGREIATRASIARATAKSGFIRFSGPIACIRLYP
jgi:hypothetical protein